METNIVQKRNINNKILDGINFIIAGLILKHYFISLLLIPYGLYIITEILYNKYNNNYNYIYYIQICKIIKEEEEDKEKVKINKIKKSKIELYIEKIISIKYKEKLTFNTLDKLPNISNIDYNDPLIHMNNKINLIYLIIHTLVIHNKYNELLNICIHIMEAYDLLHIYNDFSYNDKIEYFNNKLNEFIINYNKLFNTNYNNNSFETIYNIQQELFIKLN
jgi:hypothetical protein